MTLNTSPTTKNNRWTPPSPGVFKINVDGVTSEDGRNSSVVAIICDSCGAVIAAYGKYLQGRFLVTEVEALVMEFGILLAQDMKLTQIIVKSDATSTVKSINEMFVEDSLGHLY